MKYNASRPLGLVAEVDKRGARREDTINVLNTDLGDNGCQMGQHANVPTHIHSSIRRRRHSTVLVGYL